MKILINDLRNFFNDPSISNQRIDVFTIIFLVRIGLVNLDGDYDTIIAEVTAAHAILHASLSSYGTDINIGRGATEVRVNVMDDFKYFVSDNKWTVENKYKTVNKERAIQFYPDQLKDYNAINKTTALFLMERYATAAHTHVADFTPAFDAAASAFPLRYTNATEGQETAKGHIGSDRTGKNDGRSDLNIALFRAYNFCKFNTYADYDKMHNLFPLETLYKHPHHEVAHYSGAEGAQSTVNAAEANYDGTYYALFRNTGTTDQMVGLELTADTTVGTTHGITVKAGKSKSFQIIKTGTAGNHFLNVTNLNLTDPGSWKIDIYRED